MTMDDNDGACRAAGTNGPEVDTVTAPAAWVSALVNGDPSGLNDHPEDAAACRSRTAEGAAEGWHVVGVAHDAEGATADPWFSWSAHL